MVIKYPALLLACRKSSQESQVPPQGSSHPYRWVCGRDLRLRGLCHHSQFAPQHVTQHVHFRSLIISPVQAWESGGVERALVLIQACL